MSYSLVDTYPAGSGFFDRFNFYERKSISQTSDFAAYQSRANAEALGLITTGPDGPTVIRVDSTTIVNASSLGRPTVRIQSAATLTFGLYIFDIAHAPIGCGIWPALWFKKTTGPTDPSAAEVDIFEAINMRTSNGIGFYNNGHCYASPAAQSKLNITQMSCGVNVNDRSAASGCNYDDLPVGSAGDAFNQQGGGVYAMEMTSNYMNYYYWPRAQIPSDVANGNPDPSSWGMPYINFPFDCCSPDWFQGLNLILNINVCGTWVGGSTDPQCSGLWTSPATCNAYMAAHPEGLTEGYWSINSFKIYQKQQQAAFARNPTATCPADAVVTATITQTPVSAVLAPSPSVKPTTTKSRAPSTTGKTNGATGAPSASLLPYTLVLAVMLMRKFF
ncbi:concanavalin A-like lectin/glucanase domain-containing protein [Polychytrium aggregatum]|uniref:concanavalin A-like lectin/glucanase domain-containing protein n=1 Tax=Polychytrium aggregatum TaxID=110093 RepID=UPI0022FE8056|nr:concanavalin A-like lectin/glucanase domain-containing protein [Polychytrium aggregatum]KAI9202251.1 concanavalin A-like lectin/glucanase domain-containing protein [Polychytrium aggregatum]